MQKLREYTLSTKEVLDAVEEYLRNTTGDLSEKDKRAGCEFIASKGGPDDDKVKMSFRAVS